LEVFTWVYMGRVPKPKRKTRVLSVRVPEALIRDLEEKASREGYICPSELLRQALRSLALLKNEEAEEVGLVR
jgi:metal-responsive CopG/Arc/MetJ family transcriptional regulator